MAVFKCKMCGGSLEISEGQSICTCEYCGTEQTLPKLNSDKKTNLYDRADHFRRNNDYDKAMSIYEQILNEDATDAEAYWSIVLCRYGIEYVEDPATHKRIPTINRAQYTSIFSDEDYKSAIQNSSENQKIVYEKEAKAIDEIQKGILSISEKEDPFDVFICYKETDDTGRRTPDSVLANDLYHQLVQEGFKVFFSRITLEDKLGQEYEPYIFAALNSAKVMVALGTKPEYFKAVWVKNEWSRFLALIKSGANKTLVPAYRDMDPYELPEEFSHLQALDMSKLGFMQDLIRGIKKIVSVDTMTTTVTNPVNTNNNDAVSPLLKRAFLFLEDGNFREADEYCERVLDQDPENAQAYLGKLMVENKVRIQDDLVDCELPFDTSSNYQKAVRFGNEELSSKLKGYVAHIKERNESERLNGIYEEATNLMKQAATSENGEHKYITAAEKFKSIVGFKDADNFVTVCLNLAEESRKDAIYSSALSKMQSVNVGEIQKAVEGFEQISGWKDADEQVLTCQKKIQEINAEEETNRLERERQAEERRIAAEKATKKRKRTIAIIISVIAACFAIVILLKKIIIPNSKYNAAVVLFNSGKYDEAISAFTALDGYKDCTAQIEKCKIAIVDAKYATAVKLYNDGKYEDAYKAFSTLDYKDSNDKASECLALKQKAELKNITVGSTIKFGFYEQDNNTVNGKEEIEWKVLAVESNKALVISQYALDCQQYNTLSDTITWESCTLRKWLNDTFYNVAFSTYHQQMIINSTVVADKNPSYSTNTGNSTTDQVFLLSIMEANNYFTSDSARLCQGTAYCYAQGAYKNNNGNCGWWLRTSGRGNRYAAFVIGMTGGIRDYGVNICEKFAVRPALWIDLGI